MNISTKFVRMSCSVTMENRKSQHYYLLNLLFYLLISSMSINHLVQSCIIPERNAKFGDFGGRADVVLRVKAVAIGRPATEQTRYNATFEVVGSFSVKSDRHAEGDIITIGPFGNSPPCVQIAEDSQYILFLRRHEADATSKVTYSLRYNPVPMSRRNIFFFGRVLAGKITGRTIMMSGCRALRQPKNGRIQCTQQRNRCRITCKTGFNSASTRYRRCDISTGIWHPRDPLQCISSTLSSAQNPANVRSLLNGVRKTSNTRSWSPTRRRIIFSSNEEEEEEEEELEEEEEEEEETFRKPPPKPPAKKVVKPRSTTTTIAITTTTEHSRLSTRGNETTEKSSQSPTEEVTTNSVVVQTTSYQMSSEAITTQHTINQNVDPEPTESTSNSPPTLPDSNIFGRLGFQVPFRDPPVLTASAESISLTTEGEIQTISYQVGSNGDEWVGIDGANNKPLQGFGGTVLGCPTYDGSVTINSVWRDGFDGLAYFPPVRETITGGWLVRIAFNIPILGLETYTVDQFAVSRSTREYCVTPKHYATDLYQDLTVSFVGKLSNGNISFVTGTSQLLGICSNREIRNKTIGKLLPYDDPHSNMSTAWLNSTQFPFTTSYSAYIDETNVVQQSSTETSTKSPTTTTNQHNIVTATTDRCDPASPNGNRPVGGFSTPHWTRSTGQLSGFDANEVLHKSILFYEAQRSGKLPENNRILWRGDSDLKDGCLANHDLTGGWYNAGGNVKNTSLIAFSTTLLTWGALKYRDAYEEANETQNMLAQIRWATDYLLKCHTNTNELIVQVGDFVSASTDWKPPEISNSYHRRVYAANQENPAGNVASDVSAALAAASMLFNETDPIYARTCLEHAITLFTFSQNHPQEYEENAQNSTSNSTENGALDDISWAALWLFQATNVEGYLTRAEEIYNRLNNETYIFYFGDKTLGIATLLSELSPNPLPYRRTIWNYMRWLQQGDHYTEHGLLWLDQLSPTMFAVNSAFLALQGTEFAENPTTAISYYFFANDQMLSILGGLNNPGYVVGIGNNPPTQPHHRASSCPEPPEDCSISIATHDLPNPNILFGALVSGPERNERYVDGVDEYIYNKVGITYNAGLQSLAAGLKVVGSDYWFT